ncbi:hypothetical protein C8R44DRAFT_815439 [Mycena epipterygia]|nr:hypothetical protein C8R44DRAFT_815439 [Mycena epipterygia]
MHVGCAGDKMERKSDVDEGGAFLEIIRLFFSFPVDFISHFTVFRGETRREGTGSSPANEQLRCPNAHRWSVHGVSNAHTLLPFFFFLSFYHRGALSALLWPFWSAAIYNAGQRRIFFSAAALLYVTFMTLGVSFAFHARRQCVDQFGAGVLLALRRERLHHSCRSWGLLLQAACLFPSGGRLSLLDLLSRARARCLSCTNDGWLPFRVSVCIRSLPLGSGVRASVGTYSLPTSAYQSERCSFFSCSCRVFFQKAAHLFQRRLCLAAALNFFAVLLPCCRGCCRTPFIYLFGGSLSLAIVGMHVGRVHNPLHPASFSNT